MAVGAVVAAAAPALISGVGGYIGQRQANTANWKIAKAQMAWEAKMSSTAYSRAVADMRSAGLNPALMYGHGGAASTPGAPGASVQDVVGPATSSAIQTMMARKQLSVMDAQEAAARASADASIASAEKTQSENQRVLVEKAFDQAKYGYYFNPDGTMRPELRELLRAEFNSSMASNAMAVKNFELLSLKEPEARAMAKLFESIGSGGKAAQIFGPLLLSFLRSR